MFVVCVAETNVTISWVIPEHHERCPFTLFRQIGSQRDAASLRATDSLITSDCRWSFNLRVWLWYVHESYYLCVCVCVCVCVCGW